MKKNDHSTFTLTSFQQGEGHAISWHARIRSHLQVGNVMHHVIGSILVCGINTKHSVIFKIKLT